MRFEYEEMSNLNSVIRNQCRCCIRSIKGASGIKLSQKSAQIPLHNYPKQDSVLIDFHYSAQSQFLCLQRIQTSQTLGSEL